MLRLEKGKNREIVIRLPERKVFLNRSFLKAFSFALALHLMPLLLFQIQSFIGTEGIVQTTVYVDVDCSDSSDCAIAVDSSEVKEVKWPVPLSGSPKMPSISFNERSSRIGDLERNELASLFRELEEDWDYLVAKPQRPGMKGVFVSVSGGLSDLMLLTKDSDLQQSMPSGLAVGKNQTVFDVRVDGKSGKIIWFDTLQRSPDAALQLYAESILGQMQFSSDSRLFIKDGIIEITVVSR